MKRVMNDNLGYSGRTFFFFGRAAKKLEDLPDLDERTYRIEPGSLPLGSNNPDPRVIKAVQEAAKVCEEKGDFDAL